MPDVFTVFLNKDDDDDDDDDDSGGSRGGARRGRAPPPSPPLFLDQTEDRSPEKNLFGRPSPPYLRDWMTAPPYLKVWIRHCTTSTSLGTNCILS